MTTARDHLYEARDAIDNALAKLDVIPPRVESVDYPALPAFGDFRLGARSVQRVEADGGIHPDLRAVLELAIRISPYDFGIPATGGVRSIETQKALVAKGASGTLRSRHLTGHAVDVYAIEPETGKASWADRYMDRIHLAFVEAAGHFGIVLRWGKDWDEDGIAGERGERDGAHHELVRRVYGDNPYSMSEAAAAFLREIKEGKYA